MGKIKNNKINKAMSRRRANTTVEATLLITLAILTFISAQPYVYRAVSGFWRKQIDELYDSRDPTTIPGKSKYIGTEAWAYEYPFTTSAAFHGSLFESTNETTNIGNTTSFIYSTHTVSGGRSAPGYSSDTERITLE